MIEDDDQLLNNNELDKQRQYEEEQELLFQQMAQNTEAFLKIAVDVHKTLSWFVRYVEENKKLNKHQHQAVFELANGSKKQ